MELNEAYLYYSFVQQESDPRIRGIWENFMKMEITHFNECARLMKQYEGRDIRDLVKADVIGPLVVFEQNKDYVNSVIDNQLDLAPNNMEFMRMRDLPDNWASFGYQRVMNAKGVPSEEVVGKAGPSLVERDQAENIRRVKQEMARRVEKGMAAVPAR